MNEPRRPGEDPALRLFEVHLRDGGHARCVANDVAFNHDTLVFSGGAVGDRRLLAAFAAGTWDDVAVLPTGEEAEQFRRQYTIRRPDDTEKRLHADSAEVINGTLVLRGAGRLVLALAKHAWLLVAEVPEEE